MVLIGSHNIVIDHFSLLWFAARDAGRFVVVTPEPSFIAITFFYIFRTILNYQDCY